MGCFCTHLAYITLLKRIQFDMEKSFHNLNIDVLKELWGFSVTRFDYNEELKSDMTCNNSMPLIG